jgi:uncharacterized membrane protein
LQNHASKTKQQNYSLNFALDEFLHFWGFFCIFRAILILRGKRRRKAVSNEFESAFFFPGYLFKIKKKFAVINVINKS